MQEFSRDYGVVRHEQVETDGRLEQFFDAGHVRHTFANQQVLDFAGLRGRTLSASYMPAEGDPRCPALLARLRATFDRHAQDGHVVVYYDTRLYVGGLVS